jgi:predicted RNA methylase
MFYATFIPGLRLCIEEAIRKRFPDARILKSIDGAVLFETGTPYDQLNFFCFNNIFDVVGVREGAAPIESHIREFLSGVKGGCENIVSRNNKKFRTFRIMVSVENKPSPIGESLRCDAENYISRVSGLKPDRRGGNAAGKAAEFWFIGRSEGFSLFAKRLTLRPSWDKSLHPGELPPPLAWMLCFIAQLKPGSAVLDPFCGYGSIAEAALRHFHVKQFAACDSSDEAAAFTSARFNRGKRCADSRFLFYKADFRSLPSLLSENSFDAIVTDPPWGLFGRIDSGFYEDMFRLFGTVLKEGGKAVVLCANREGIVAASNFRLEEEIPILLSGRKASIFLFEK